MGLYFSDRPPTRIPAMLRLGRQNIDIPAGDRSYTIADSYVLPVDARVEAVQAPAHYRAREGRGEATLPGGTERKRTRLRGWGLRWVALDQLGPPSWPPNGPPP